MAAKVEQLVEYYGYQFRILWHFHAPTTLQFDHIDSSSIRWKRQAQRPCFCTNVIRLPEFRVIELDRIGKQDRTDLSYLRYQSIQANLCSLRPKVRVWHIDPTMSVGRLIQMLNISITTRPAQNRTEQHHNKQDRTNSKIQEMSDIAHHEHIINFEIHFQASQ